MKKLLLTSLLSLSVFSLQSQAAPSPRGSECVPTSTVEKAKAEYDAGIAAITKSLLASYDQAAVESDQANAKSLADYKAKIASINALYDAEVAAIRANLNLGWREALDAAELKRNEALKAALATYSQEGTEHAATYHQRIDAAQATYNSSAQALADTYNRAVCAAK